MVKHQNTNSSVHAALRAIYLQTRTHEIKTGGCEASPASLSSLHSHLAQRHRRPLQADTPQPHLPASAASRATSVQFKLQSRETFIEQLQTLSTDSSNAERCLFTSPAVNHGTLASDPPSHDVSTGARAAFKFNRSCWSLSDAIGCNDSRIQLQPGITVDRCSCCFLWALRNLAPACLAFECHDVT